MMMMMTIDLCGSFVLSAFERSYNLILPVIKGLRSLRAQGKTITQLMHSLIHKPLSSTCAPTKAAIMVRDVRTASARGHTARSQTAPTASATLAGTTLSKGLQRLSRRQGSTNATGLQSLRWAEDVPSIVNNDELEGEREILKTSSFEGNVYQGRGAGMMFVGYSPRVVIKKAVAEVPTCEDLQAVIKPSVEEERWKAHAGGQSEHEEAETLRFLDSLSEMTPTATDMVRPAVMERALTDVAPVRPRNTGNSRPSTRLSTATNNNPNTQPPQPDA